MPAFAALPLRILLRALLVMALGLNGFGASAMAMAGPHSHGTLGDAIAAAPQPDAAVAISGCHDAGSDEVPAPEPVATPGSAASDDCCSDTGCDGCGCALLAAADPLHRPSFMAHRRAVGRAGLHHLVASDRPSRLNRPPIA